MAMHVLMAILPLFGLESSSASAQDDSNLDHQPHSYHSNFRIAVVATLRQIAETETHACEMRPPKE